VHSFDSSHATLIFYGVTIALLVLLSGFFSCAETGLMAINRYRLRHDAVMGKRVAILILKLLERPDRLLGMILIGNNVANIFASALATVVAIHLFGEVGVIVFSMILTGAILIFAEVAPKTLAALYPEQVVKIVAWPVFILLKLFYPLVWVINTISNGLLSLLHIQVSRRVLEPLNREELRSVVYEGTGKVLPYQKMLLGVLDLNKATVNDVMVPRHKITGIDLAQEWSIIQQQIAKSPYDWLPVYRENIDQIAGILHVRELMGSVLLQALTQDVLLKLLHEPYFIPEGALLNIQLQNFQRQPHQRIALVVDEYGEIQGLLTLKDILEEIVGEFTSRISETSKLIQAKADGSYLVDGSVTIRELSRATQWPWPKGGPRTLNGLIVEYLESIPRTGICVRIADYPIEIITVQENRVKTARIFARLT
jgi:Mg2+/Co2+ transporter CorB